MTKNARTSQTAFHGVELSKKTLQMIGREQHLKRLEGYLRVANERRCVYFYAPGGLGKTRLLEEFVRSVKNAGQDFHCSDIMDLYHIDIHSHLGIEEAIVAGLDSGNRYFRTYREKAKEYQQKHDAKLQLESTKESAKRLREEVEKAFKSDIETMARNSRKLVLCFDTFERIQFAESVVDEAAARHAPSLWLRSWLIKTLSQIPNALIVLAGRPRQPEAAQTALIEVMRRDFGGHFEAITLPPLTRDETESFIKALPDSEKVLPAQYHEVVSWVTAGKPIFLHLVIDLLRTLTRNPGEILDMFAKWHEDTDAIADLARSHTAQDEIQTRILDSLYNDAGQLGGYLSRMALMPKGVDQDIFEAVLGLSRDEAETLLTAVRPLSFIKEYKPRPGEQSDESSRVFLHDEMYQLLTWPKAVPTIRYDEQDVARRLADYLEKQIEAQEDRFRQLSTLERPRLRRRIQQLQTERMYYWLVADPAEGYKEYRRLANIATQTDQDDFGMKLLDEFLQFYSAPRRQGQFSVAKITAEQVTRERALMWMERLHWGEYYVEAVSFADEVLRAPNAFEIREAPEDLIILGNIIALWARDSHMTKGYREETLTKAEAMWQRLDQLNMPPDTTTTAGTLARARLATSIGFMYDDIARLDRAEHYYALAVQHFDRLEGFEDEVAFLLNNLAYLNANRGKMEDANLQANRARRIFVQFGNQRGEAWALSTLANVEIRAGDYDRAISYATLALERFAEVVDERGIVRALLARAQARRKDVKSEILGGSGEKQVIIKKSLQYAEDDLNRAIDLAAHGWLGNELPKLYAKRAKVYREMGMVAKREGATDQAQERFRKGKEDFQRALGEGGGGVPALKSESERWDTRVDFAEHYFRADNAPEATKQLQNLEKKLPHAHAVESLAPESCRLRGKMERLRGEMTQAKGDLMPALKHYIRAYSYFDRFSPQDRKRRSMSNKVQDVLLMLSKGDQDPLDELQRWLRDEHPEPYDEICQYVKRLGQS